MNSSQHRCVGWATFIALALVVACSPTNTDAEIVELPLSAVDGFSLRDEPAPIETAFQRYQDTLIATEGIRLGPGLPPGLGSDQYVGLHEPPQPGKKLRVLLSGNVPPEHGKRYRIVGRIVPAGSTYQIAVEAWEVAPSVEVEPGESDETQ